MYEVIDGKTKQLMGIYKTRKRASSRANKLDLIYGAVRYFYRRVEG
jgi:hypothetical protein